MFEAHLRSGEMLSLEPSSFLAPTEGGVRSWGHCCSLRLVPREAKLDTTTRSVSTQKRCLWLVPVFERLQRRQSQDKPLLNLNYAEYLLLCRRAAENLQVDMVPYHGRHSEASVDRAENLRTLESIQKRGRWKSAQSVRRYEKKRTCQPELAQLVQAHGKHCNNLLPSVLLHGHASPTPPRLLRLL